MNCEISESLKALAAEYERATTQKERDRLMHEIARVSDKQERDRDGAHRRDTRQGVFGRDGVRPHGRETLFVG